MSHDTCLSGPVWSNCWFCKSWYWLQWSCIAKRDQCCYKWQEIKCSILKTLREQLKSESFLTLTVNNPIRPRRWRMLGSKWCPSWRSKQKQTIVKGRNCLGYRFCKIHTFEWQFGLLDENGVWRCGGCLKQKSHIVWNTCPDGTTCPHWLWDVHTSKMVSNTEGRSTFGRAKLLWSVSTSASFSKCSKGHHLLDPLFLHCLISECNKNLSLPLEWILRDHSMSSLEALP